MEVNGRSDYIISNINVLMSSSFKDRENAKQKHEILQSKLDNIRLDIESAKNQLKQYDEQEAAITV